MTDLPAPPVPPDLDLRGCSYFLLDGYRLANSWFGRVASGEAFRAGILLWCKAWHELPASSLPDDDGTLAQAVDRPFDQWLAIRADALHGFRKYSDGRLYHPVLSDVAFNAGQSMAYWSAKEIKRLLMLSGEWAALRAAVFARDNYTCRYCGRRGGRLECDHVFPVCRGGVSTIDNLATACLPCNRSKGMKTVQEWLQ